MKRMMIAGFAAGAAMMVGGALAAVATAPSAQHSPAVDANAEIMNPMVGGQAMLPNRNLLENISLSPDHTALTAALRDSGIADALKADGEFTLFAPTNGAMTGALSTHSKADLAKAMGYLVVPGKYDSQTLLRVIGEGGGEARLRTIGGGLLLARMNGPTNVVLMDEKGDVADIAIYDVYDKNGVMHVIDHMLEPGAAPSRQIAAK